MHRGGLSVGILQDITERAVQNPWFAVTERGCMLAQSLAASGRLDADQLDGGIVEKRIKHPRGVAAAADAGNNHIRKPSHLLQTLPPCLATDDRLKIADDSRERMRSNDTADDVMRVRHAGHPIA